MLYETWWLDDSYSYGRIPFAPAGMSPEELERGCFQARREFYSWSSMIRRLAAPVNRSSFFLLRLFLIANVMHRSDVRQRLHHPLGDRGWNGQLLRVE